jgi:hypothetical protein
MSIEKSETLIKTADYLDIKLRDHGHAKLKKGWKYPATALPMSRLYFSLTDGGVLECGNTKINTVPGKVYLVPVNECSVTKKLWLWDIKSEKSTATLAKDCEIAKVLLRVLNQE